MGMLLWLIEGLLKCLFSRS
ncbi:hypothetical protein [Cardinium endosymbiont of Tipula unca]